MLVPHIFFQIPHFSVEWGTIPHNFEILDATLGIWGYLTVNRTKEFIP
jgi:hypothetical protein